MLGTQTVRLCPQMIDETLECRKIEYVRHQQPIDGIVFEFLENEVVIILGQLPPPS